MPTNLTRIKNNQITDTTIVANAKIVPYSISSTLLANNLTYGSDLTITGNLTVQGNSTAIDTTITTIEDPVILLASTQTGSPTVDIGFIGDRGSSSNVALVWREANSEFITAYTSTGETNTTISISSYANFHTNDANVSGNLTIGGNVIGNITFDGTLTAGNLATPGTVSAAGNLTSGNVLTAGQVSAGGNVTGANVNTAGTVSASTMSASGDITGGNVLTAGQVSAGGNVTGGNVLTAGIVSTGGNVFVGTGNAGYVYGNAYYMTGIDQTASANKIFNGDSNVSIASANANITMSVNGTSNVVVVDQNGINVTGYLSTSGNINGSNITASASLTGGNIYTSGTVSATGTVFAGNVDASTGTVSANTISASGNITAGNITTSGSSGNITGANYITANVFSASGNITADYYFGNGSQLTGVAAASVNAAALVGNTLSSNVIYSSLQTVGTLANLSVTDYVSAGGNVIGGNIYTAGLISAAGTAQLGNVQTVGIVSASGNVIGNYFIGNGSQLTGIDATRIINGTSNVSIPAANSNIQMSVNGTANVVVIADTGANITGYANVTGNLSAGNAEVTGNVNSGNLLTTGLVSATGNVYANTVVTSNIEGQTQLTISTVSGDIVINPAGSNIDVSTAWINNLSDPVNNQDAATKKYVDDVAQGLNVHDSTQAATTANLATISGGTVSYNNGNAGVGANLVTTGTYTNIDGVAINTVGTRILVKNESNTAWNGIYTYSNATVLVRATDYDTVPEVEAGDFVFNLAGNVYGNTGWVQTSNTVTIGTGPIEFTQFSGTGAYTAGNGISITGTVINAIYDGNITTNGSNQLSIANGAVLLNPNITNATGTSFSASGNIDGGNFNTGGLVSATGNVTGGNINTVGLVAGGNITSGGTVSAVGDVTGNNVVAVYQVSAATVSASGTIQGGNIGTAGIVTATGNITGGNISTAGQISATGTATVGNVLTAGEVSAAGNVTGGNVIGGNIYTAGEVSAAGNITANPSSFFIGNGSQLTGVAASSVNANALVGNTLSANVLYSSLQTVGTLANLSVAGNVTAGNISTSGSGGNISGANVISANTFNGTTLSVSGSITGGSVDTAGTVSATGNITGGNVNTTGTVSSNVVSATTVNSTTVSASGNVTGGNVLTGGIVSAGGNVTGANFSTTGTVSAGVVSASGNVTGGNVLFGSGYVSGTGNVYAANFIGNISGNIDAAGANTEIQFNTTGDILGANANFTYNYATNVFTVNGGNIDGGNVSASGTVTGGNLSVSGDTINGTNGIITINGAGADTNFAVNGDTVANVFFVDAGTGTASFGSDAQTTNAIVAFNATNSILMPVGNTAQRPTGVTGMLRFNTTLNYLEVYNNSQWQEVGQDTFTVITDEQFNGDGSTVQFTLGSTQTTSSVMVSINGVVQIPTTAYAVSGTYPTCYLTFTEAPQSGDVIDVREFTTTVSVASISSGNSSVTATGSTIDIQGNLNPTANLTYSLGNATNRWSNLYVGGNTIYLGNLQLKEASANTFAVYTADGITEANIAVGNIDVTSIQSGNSSISIAAPNGNAILNANGVNSIVAASTGAYVTGVVSASGNITGSALYGGGFSLSGNTITSSGTTLTIDPNGSGGVDGAVIISGNLSVTGNITYIDSNVITTNEKSITLANNQSSGAALDGSGIDIGNNTLAYWRFNNATTSWQSNIAITPAANATLNLGGTSNYWGTVYANAVVSATTVSAIGNVVGGNITTAGLVTATGNVTGGNLTTTGIIRGNTTISLTGNGVAIGNGSGNTTVNNNGIAIGTLAGVSQGGNAIAIGYRSGQVSQSSFAVALGGFAGANSQGLISVAVGYQAGQANQASQAVAIGYQAGQQSQGNNSIAIGTNAGTTSQANNTIILNATGTEVSGINSQANSFYVAPIRSATGNVGVLQYNNSTNEVTYASSVSLAGNVTGGNITTAGLISATGNTTAGNILTGGIVSATGNIVIDGIASFAKAGAFSWAAQISNTGSFTTTGLISATGNVTGGNLSAGTGTVTLGNIVNANGNGVGNIGSSSLYFNTVFAKATSAQYADLAENYVADAAHAPGTVLSFGGTREVTKSEVNGDRRVAGVVSTNPSYIMNAGCTGEFVATVALTGRVPTRITGPVRKGDMMVSNGDGTARAEANPQVGSVIGKALENFDGAGEGIIEVVIGRF